MNTNQQTEQPIPEEFENWISDWLKENVISDPDDWENHNSKVVWARAIAFDIYRHVSSQLLQAQPLSVLPPSPFPKGYEQAGTEIPGTHWGKGSGEEAYFNRSPPPVGDVGPRFVKCTDRMPPAETQQGDKCACGVPIKLHNTACGWENATVQVDEKGIVTTEGHPLKGEHFNIIQSTSAIKDRLYIQSLETENTALIKEVEAWENENFYNIEQTAKTERAGETYRREEVKQIAKDCTKDFCGLPSEFDKYFDESYPANTERAGEISPVLPRWVKARECKPVQGKVIWRGKDGIGTSFKNDTFWKEDGWQGSTDFQNIEWLEEAPPTTAEPVKDTTVEQLETGCWYCNGRHMLPNDCPYCHPIAPTEQPAHVPDPKGEIPEERLVCYYCGIPYDHRYDECSCGCAIMPISTKELAKENLSNKNAIATLTKEKDRAIALANAHRQGLEVCVKGLIEAGLPYAAEPIQAYLAKFPELK